MKSSRKYPLIVLSACFALGLNDWPFSVSPPQSLFMIKPEDRGMLAVFFARASCPQPSWRRVVDL